VITLRYDTLDIQSYCEQQSQGSKKSVVSAPRIDQRNVRERMQKHVTLGNAKGENLEF
jgi:hypothetical protein